MAASVLFTCGLNEQQLPPYVHISEESQQDGSFLISSILGQRLRISKAGTILVCLQHNYQHYFNAGLRLGYNSSLFIGKTLNVIDPFSELMQDDKQPMWIENERLITSVLFQRISEEVKSVINNRSCTTILIDNLSILLNLGATKEEVLQFCNDLTALTEMYNNLTIVTKLNNCEMYTDLDKNIAKRSSLGIRLVRLTSGVFREVDGKLKINRALEIGSFKNEELNKEVLYKVNERNIKLFNPGEVGV